MIELIEALTDMCIRQLSIIKDQAAALLEHGITMADEEEIAALQRRLRLIVGDDTV